MRTFYLFSFFSHHNKKRLNLPPSPPLPSPPLPSPPLPSPPLPSPPLPSPPLPSPPPLRNSAFFFLRTFFPPSPSLSLPPLEIHTHGEMDEPLILE